MPRQDDYIRTALRVPPELHRRIHEAAAASGRTFNAELVSRLERSFELGHGASSGREGVLLMLGSVLQYMARAFRRMHDHPREDFQQVLTLAHAISAPSRSDVEAAVKGIAPDADPRSVQAMAGLLNEADMVAQLNVAFVRQADNAESAPRHERRRK